MAIKWSDQSSSTNADRLGAVTEPFQLSDGTLVWLDQPSAVSGTTTISLKYSSSHAAVSGTIATFSVNQSSVTDIAACVDSSNNIFVLWQDEVAGTQSGQYFAFTGTPFSSWSWSSSTKVSSGTFPGYTSGGFMLVWTNDGGGTGGHGHLVLFYPGDVSGKTTPAATVWDAGVYVAGSGSPFTGSWTGSNLSGNPAFSWPRTTRPS